MGENLLDQAKQWRKLVLLAELAGWLHDLGKLSYKFVARLLEGEPDVGAWNHEDVFELDQASTQGVDIWLQNTLVQLGSEHVSLLTLIASHHKGLNKAPTALQKLFIKADQHESGEDEYNAIEINQRTPAQVATVFGRETDLNRGNLIGLDCHRLGLYPSLALKLPGFLTQRCEVWKYLKAKMRHGLGKTQRAANDIRLDQHVWGVASRFKAFVMRDLIMGREKGIDPNFRLLSVCWDSWAQITPFARLSDVVGRKAMLDGLRKRLRKLIEDKYALGNRVYEDDDGIHFMVADVEGLQAELESKLRHAADEETKGEVQLSIKLGEPTQWVTDLVGLMKTAREQTPLVEHPHWLDKWTGSPSGEVCPVCQKRPLEGEREICKWCEKQRGKGLRQRLEQGTVWNAEVAGKDGRLALIVARFDLERWLNGDMLHTSFITSPQDIAHQYQDMADVCNWRFLAKGAQWYLSGKKIDNLGDYRGNMEKARRKLRQSQEPQIPDERRPVMQEEALAQIPGAAWGFWAALVKREMVGHEGEKGERILAMAERIKCLYGLDKLDAFLLALARKNPSAARLLRVWQTTEDFLQAQAQAIYHGAAQQERVVWKLDRILPSGFYQAETVEEGQFEIFVPPLEEEQAFSLAHPVEYLDADRVKRLSALPKLRLTAGEQNRQIDVECGSSFKKSYAACQVITASPNLLLALVPADQAMALASSMQEAYAKEFGKVQGRLPFHVGLIYMDAHYPMFAALDTARRMAESFDRLGDRLLDAELEKADPDGGVYHLTLKNERFGAWTWDVPYLRGDGEIDWYHPYFLVRKGERLAERGMSVVGPEGRWVHVKELEAGDTLALWPNLFDFLFLDTVTRRFDAQLPPEADRRPHPLLGERHSPRPYMLERAVRLRQVWDDLCRVTGITDTRLAAVESLLGQKWRAWGLDESSGPKPPETWAAWRWLVEQTVARDLGGNPELQEAILDGRFFDAVELYRHVLKQSVDQDKETK